MTGVAMASGTQAKSKVKNSRIHACCIPAARMVKTVCVASNSPTPNQTAAIHSQREDDAPVVIFLSMSQIVVQSSCENPQMQPITLAMQGTE
jgi:hypothetical protein